MMITTKEGDIALLAARENGIQSRSELRCASLDRTDIVLVFLFAVVSSLVMLPGLGAQSLATWDEAIYGAIARDLLAHPGATLYYGGRPWFEKPPFMFWLMAGSSWTFGITEFALRLPTAIFGIGAVILQYLIGRRLGGRIAGMMAAILLLAVPQFIAYTRLAMLDVPLLTLGMLSIFFLLYEQNQTRISLLAGAALGLAALTKSAAALLFVPGFLAITIARRGLRALWSKETFLAVAVALAIALAWPVWSAMTYGRSFLDQYLFFHIIERFLRPLEGHIGTPFYYFDLYWYNAGWAAPVHGAGIVLAGVLAAVRRDRLLGAIAVLAVGAFIMVNAQGTKIGWYLMPVYPAAALAAALAITLVLPSRREAFIALASATLLAVPAIGNGRSAFVEEYNILDYSPEVRSLRTMHPALEKRLPLLYTVSVSTPAPRFYLAERVESVDETELGRLVAEERAFHCLLFKHAAIEFLTKYPRAKFEVIASTASLAVIEHQ